MASLLLEIVEGARAGDRIPIIGEVELGRDPALAHPLDDEQVSRHHARVSAPSGAALIEDLGSMNGTYVNDQPIAGRQELDPGDRIRVGLTVIELRTEEDATVRGSAVRARPPLTRVGDDLLEPASEAELAPVRADQADPPSLISEEREPAFVRPSAIRQGIGRAGGGPSQDASVEEPGATSGEIDTGAEDPDAIIRRLDTRVRAQPGVGAFALIALAGLAAAIVLGAR